jgi:UDP-N-acetylmuramate: L-alanyl-gamma-D-glutamyl-meso-diaminopimelate ligase
LILNNLEFDHADIFPDLDAIKRQFHHLVRTVPGTGLIIAPEHDANLQAVLSLGCWTPLEAMGDSDEATWSLQNVNDDGSQFDVCLKGERQGTVKWPLIGMHNVHNAIMAIAAARHAGVPVAHAIAALGEFQNVKRRMEVVGEARGITIYDDFAHHPTAIESTLHGLRHTIVSGRIIAILEPRSNTMRMGIHKDSLADSLAEADEVVLYQPDDLGWDLDYVSSRCKPPCQVMETIDAIIQHAIQTAQNGDHILIMSNGAFGGLHKKLLDALQ